MRLLRDTGVSGVTHGNAACEIPSIMLSTLVLSAITSKKQVKQRKENSIHRLLKCPVTLRIVNAGFKMAPLPTEAFYWGKRSKTAFFLSFRYVCGNISTEHIPEDIRVNVRNFGFYLERLLFQKKSHLKRRTLYCTLGLSATGFH